MVDFSLSEEQVRHVAWVREFMDSHVRPVVAELDKISDPDERFPWGIIEKAHGEGLMRFGLPEAYGGTPVDEVTLCLLMEEFGAADIGVGGIIAQYWNCVALIDRMGNDFHRDTFIRPYLDNPRAIYALAMTEPTAGTDAQLPYDAPDGGPMLEAVPDGDEIVLNGVKTYSSYSNVADVIIVFARTDKSVGLTQGMTAFIVTKDTPGFSVARTFDLMGHRLAPIAELHFDDCRIPKENQLTPWNGGFAEMSRFTVGRYWVGARCLGVARAAFDLALEYAKTRVQGGKPIIEHQMVARQLGEMAMTIEAARNTIWKAAWAAEHPEQADPIVLRMARVLGSEAAMKVALDAVRIHGGPGTFTDVGVEKLFRDAATGLHPAPLDVQLMIMGQVLAGNRQGPVAPLNVAS
ncbi:acyl-CoA dehydrogenase family protein [Amycolatopsis pithecellobii]|uniref:acyl-CoA dehydrogenase family protein n=1 Tax=Amycolatopsis pithecellobii TaxID=664692 RepID=UPI00140916AB|nr:acyl-CoA dehydrogenase family protein [Amycolatopsis pithecellobii]